MFILTMLLVLKQALFILVQSLLASSPVLLFVFSWGRFDLLMRSTSSHTPTREINWSLRECKGMNAWVHESDHRKTVQAAMCYNIQQEINSPALPSQVSAEYAAVAINFYRGGEGGGRRKGRKFWTFTKLVPLITICKFSRRDQSSKWFPVNFNSSFTWQTENTGRNSQQLECKLSN